MSRQIAGMWSAHKKIDPRGFVRQPLSRHFPPWFARRGRRLIVPARFALAREVLVHRELADIRRRGQAGGGGRRADSLLGETIELLTRLPEVDYAPAALDRARGVEDEPVRRIAIRID